MNVFNKILVLVSVTVLFSSSANATLISIDDTVLGSDTVTLDTSTNLEWLDVSFTLGMSYDGVVAGSSTPSSQFFGWSVATVEQVISLFQSAGLGDNFHSNSSEANDSFWLIADNLGVSLSDPSIELYSIDGLTASPSNRDPAKYAFYDVTKDGSSIFTSDSTGFSGHWTGSQSYPTDFIWAVRATAPVPEPATILLFGTGIAGLAGSRIRRKKK